MKSLYFLRIFLLMVVSSMLCVLNTNAQTTEKPKKNKLVTYGNKGIELRPADSNYLMQLDLRMQFRISYPIDNNPVTLNDFEKESVSLSIRRARLKIGGHAFKPWIKYYMEYELAASALLDFRFMIEKYPWLKLKVGQWKAQYNRERVISSGKQQTVDRSILTRAFTLDRQQGISLFGNFGRGVGNFNYWASIFNGMGRGGRQNDDNHLMYMSRWQWNFMGKPLEFSGSDLSYHKRFRGIIAIAGATNQSPYTRFSTGGGGSLAGFEEQEPGQYRVNQWMIETAAKFRGFSFQQEFHWKNIEDNKNHSRSEMVGNLVQAGYFFHHLWSAFPEKMEIFARQEFYTPDRFHPHTYREYCFGLNYFFKGHRNKLTLEASYFDYEFDNGAFSHEWRYRLQWDISL